MDVNEPDLRHILGAIGITARRANTNGWVEFPCPLAPWTHANGHDSRASAAAKVSPEGTSAFTCKACHQHGRVSKLIRLLAEYRQDDSIRPLMLAADRADAEAQVTTGFPAFEDYGQQEPDPEPLDPDAYGDLYPLASTSDYAMEYLEGRGISAATSDKLALGYDDGNRVDPATGRHYRTAARVVFPVHDRKGDLYGYTGRAIEPGVKIKVRDYVGLPKKFIILGEDRWLPDRPTIIVEGLFAFAHLHELGIDEVANIGALLGSAMTEHKAGRIIHADCPTYLLLDNDAGGDIGLFGTVRPTGEREENGAVHYLSAHVPIYIPEWPAGKDDPDQLTREEVLEMLRDTPLWGSSGDTNPFDKEYEPWL